MLLLSFFVLQLDVSNYFAHAASIFDQTSKGKCQPIEIPLCKEVPYNYTYFPNPYLQQDQQSCYRCLPPYCALPQPHSDGNSTRFTRT
ncbi:hypothetical protein ANCDUO_19916 [Ancylostoma duodenale]|uniref:FZ domain-containing protein n=1 Tax=Ancylostoma duodenale TaxID=51022 RepID=A0A0C2C181_9BILA|nr:hypothetical protein ANCDUO_19916 [Ancylostoma duodenale]